VARKISFYTDEHVSRAVIQGLRHRGIDVLTIPEAGLMGASDEEHLSRAQREGRVIFTQDQDFLRLAAAGAEHAGIVYASQNTSVREILRGLRMVYEVLDAEEMVGHVEYL
jgi:predicted nuclease of predicted toxin-antitoxin system